MEGLLSARGWDVPWGFPDESPYSEIFTVEGRTQLDQEVTKTVNPVRRVRATLTECLAWRTAMEMDYWEGSRGTWGQRGMDGILNG